MSAFRSRSRTHFATNYRRNLSPNGEPQLCIEAKVIYVNDIQDRIVFDIPVGLFGKVGCTVPIPPDDRDTVEVRFAGDSVYTEGGRVTVANSNTNHELIVVDTIIDDQAVVVMINLPDSDRVDANGAPIDEDVVACYVKPNKRRHHSG